MKYKTLWFIASPRDFDLFKMWFDKVDFIDKLLVKYYPSLEAYSIGEKFFLEHDYDYILISTDDFLATPYHVQLLIDDVEKYNFDVVGGWMNYDFNSTALASKSALTFKPPIGLNPKNPYSIYSASQYPLVRIKDIVTGKYNSPFVKVFFNGHALTMIKRWIIEKVGIKPFKIEKKITGENAIMYDLYHSIKFQELNVNFYVDLRCFLLHFGNTLEHLKVGKVKPYVMFIPSKGEPQILT